MFIFKKKVSLLFFLMGVLLSAGFGSPMHQYRLFEKAKADDVAGEIFLQRCMDDISQLNIRSTESRSQLATLCYLQFYMWNILRAGEHHPLEATTLALLSKQTELDRDELLNNPDVIKKVLQNLHIDDFEMYLKKIRWYETKVQQGDKTPRIDDDDFTFCSFRDKVTGRKGVIHQSQLCDETPNCPQGEDEDPQECFFYKASLHMITANVTPVVRRVGGCVN